MKICIFQQALDELTAKQQLRSIPVLEHQGQFVHCVQSSSCNNLEPALDIPSTIPAIAPKSSLVFSSMTASPDFLVNVASNDYLAIGADSEMQAEFYDHIYDLPKAQRPRFGATSSRLLTGNDIQLELLERELAEWYGADSSNISVSFDDTLAKSALVCNSGYHSNLGILPAIAVLPSQTGKTLILADKLVHASIIDALRLASLHKKCEFKRYQHNDYQHLLRLVEQAGQEQGRDNGSGEDKKGLNDNVNDICRIIIVTESVFSMDGDLADLNALVAIKKSDSRVELYLDEAHAVGVFGKTGLGLAQATDTLADIDYLVGTFGKAFASMGAYIICHAMVREWLVNSMRSLIYSTALPPITHAWTRFVLQKMMSRDSDLSKRRTHLMQGSKKVRDAIRYKNDTNQSRQLSMSQSPIIPYILGDNKTALAKAYQLKQSGFYALAIRPPTVPSNTARIRLVMNAGIDEDTCQRLIDAL